MKSQTPRRSTRTGRRTPWTPIFDSRKRKGDILVGDTPATAIQYCGWDGGSASTQGSDSLDFGTASTQGTDTIDFDVDC